MSIEGFRNEELIFLELNGKRFGKINPNLQEFLEFAVNRKIEKNEKIMASRVGGQHKADLNIVVGSDRFTISVKIGKGNSVHQEPVEEFLNHLSKEFNITNDIKNAIRFFIWGDGTLNGSGNKKDRMTATEIKRRHPDIITKLRTFFKKYRRALIERFVIKGPKSRFSPDLIYYGTANRGLWARTENILNFLSAEENEARSTVPIGRLTFQAWNRAIKEGTRSEHKRGVIQLKWPTLKKDLKYLKRGKI